MADLSNGDALGGADGAVRPSAAPPPLPPEQLQRYFGWREQWGYADSIEWRAVHGSFDSPGEARVWGRPRIPLVAGQDIHALDRVLVVADSANGVSAVLDPREWLFIPPAVTVTLHRYPVGEWVLLSAKSELADDGLGSTIGTLSDQSGSLGTVVQPLLVAKARLRHRAATLASARRRAEAACMKAKRLSLSVGRGRTEGLHDIAYQRRDR